MGRTSESTIQKGLTKRSQPGKAETTAPPTAKPKAEVIADIMTATRDRRV